MQQITPAQLSDWAAKMAARLPVLLDVREGWECQTASVSPAGMAFVHMPMQTIPARLDELDKTRPIACLCHHGSRSMQVAAYLAQQGFEVINVAGGIHAWSTQVDPSIPTY
jgi:rhodanese-related sulfurtransferase